MALDLATLETRPLTDPPPAPLLRARATSSRHCARRSDGGVRSRDPRGSRRVRARPRHTVERRLTRDHQRISGLTWAPDGHALIMSSSRSGVEALYRVSLDAGAIVRVPLTGDWATQPMAAERRPRLQPDAERLEHLPRRAARRAGVRSRASHRCVVARRYRAARVPRRPQHCVRVHARRRADVWVAAADGSNPRRLTSLPVTSGPRWSPDGTSIAFGAQAAGEVRP